jgi:uncharacterized membrane protein
VAIPKAPMTIEELRTRHKPVRDFAKNRAKDLKPLEKLALWITMHVGSMGFFLLILAWTVLWLGWNSLAPQPFQFDPPIAFVLWLFISNVIQILLMPLIMVGQNVQAAAADARAEHDLAINVKAEAEIEVILTHLEYQNEMLIKMVRDMGADVGDALETAGDKPRAKPRRRGAPAKPSAPRTKRS